MAVFLLKAIQGGNFSPPAATGNEFGDVGVGSFAANFIEEFSTLGITSGCGGGNYCPDAPVTREQMAVFLLRAWYGAGYTPPTATPAADAAALVLQAVDEVSPGIVHVGGRAAPGSAVTVNGTPVKVLPDGTFSEFVRHAGPGEVVVRATADDGQFVEQSRAVSKK